MTTHVVNLQHNDGFLPDILLLTLCYYHRGIQLNPMKSFDPCSQCPQDVLVCSFVHQLQPMSLRCVFSLHQAATLLPRLWAHYHLSISPSLPDSRLSKFYRTQVKRYTTILFLKRHLRQRYTTRASYVWCPEHYSHYSCHGLITHYSCSYFTLYQYFIGGTSE